ncbi:MAG: anthranilate phosphoribosyltransferase [Pelagibacteraceae bacterium]|nr:anthranilate phosphoribosyltransferase [Pelagibacteraceae bacterium]|tara:strand:- start:17109 stop:18110 length:1002 start_codon:yes stop_codon:yes gene_type:complete
MDQIKIFNKIYNKENLNIEESSFIFNKIMSGEFDDIKITSILVGLKIKGETKEEIIGAAKVMRKKSLKINSPKNTIDTCGTGGDMKETLNISTSSAIVAASAGVKIAKHGNRSVSSKSGSADMLEKIGYKISNKVTELEESLKSKNFCFLFAQNHHTAMKNVINVRKNLGTRTIFNLLGPLTNPANASRQLLGVYSKKLVSMHCNCLKDLGSERAMVVYGLDGLDEISLSDKTYINELKDNKISEYIFNPKDYGYDLINIDKIKGGDPDFNANSFKKMINGDYKDFQKIVEINAGVTIYLSDLAKNLKEGFYLAKKVIEEGVTKNFVNSLIND